MIASFNLEGHLKDVEIIENGMRNVHFDFSEPVLRLDFRKLDDFAVRYSGTFRFNKFTQFSGDNTQRMRIVFAVVRVSGKTWKSIVEGEYDRPGVSGIGLSVIRVIGE